MEDLFRLCDEVAISGFESNFAQKLKKQLDSFCDQTELDAIGNLYAYINPQAEKKILLEAHMDEVGLIVTEIDEKGFVHFKNHCGIPQEILPAGEVYIYGKEPVFGVIGVKPPHLQKEEESKKPYQMKELFIDTGYTKEELETIIEVGNVIGFKHQSSALLGGKLSSKAMDNRFGIYTIIELARWIQENKPDYGAVILCAVQEEAGLRGARVAVNRISADLAMVFDVTHGVSPYTKDEESFALGSGVAIGLGPNLDRRLTNLLLQAAEKNQINYTREVMGGNTGTDAWAVQIGRTGIPCVLLSAPLRYMHTNIETIQKEDIKAVLSLSKYFITEVMENA